MRPTHIVHTSGQSKSLIGGAPNADSTTLATRSYNIGEYAAGPTDIQICPRSGRTLLATFIASLRGRPVHMAALANCPTATARFATSPAQPS